MGIRAASARRKSSSRERDDATAPARPGDRAAASGRVVLSVLSPLLLLPLSLLVQAGPPQGPDRVADLEREYAAALEGLFRWCRSTRLNETADDVAAELLEVDPDHGAARRWLGYKRRGGVWVAPRRRKTRHDWNRTARESYPQRRAERVDVFVDRYWQLYTGLSDAGDEEGRQRVLALALDRWPRDARFHEARGEVQRDGLWILKESARSDVVAAGLHEAARRLLAAASAPAEAMPPPFLESFGMAWHGASRSHGVTVVSMTSSEESDRVARHCHVAIVLFQLIFELETEPPADFTVALGRGERDFRKVLENLDPPAHVRDRLRQLCGFTLKDPCVLFTSPEEPALRLDAAVRATVDVLFERSFGDFGRLGWAREGFGTYLTWLVCGTRLSSFAMLGAATRSTNATGPSRNLLPDWLGNARRLAVADELPDLPYVLSVDHSAMTTNDLLAAYAFAVYLVAGRGGQLQRFLSRANNGKSTADAAIEVLGLDLVSLDARLRRWLRECH